VKRKYVLAENALKKASCSKELFENARARLYSISMGSSPHLTRPVQGNRPTDVVERLESDPALKELEHIIWVISEFTYNSKVPAHVRETIYKIYFYKHSLRDIQAEYGVSARTVRRWRQQGLEQITKLLKGELSVQMEDDFKANMEKIRQEFLQAGVGKETTDRILEYMASASEEGLTPKSQ
jgi:transposase-like protein